MNEMLFDDEIIAQIARLLQLALLTGTDIVDNLRMMRVVFDDTSDTLVLSDEYKELAESQLRQLTSEIEANQVNQAKPDIEME